MNLRNHARLLLIFSASLLVNGAEICAQQVELSALEFRSSNPDLNESFTWAKQRALEYLRSGEGTIGPWYEAALPGRNAFCIRDVAHQTEGAAALGLFVANRNTLGRFAASAAASRNWAAYWEIDGNGKPSSFDYVSDADFWFNLPANFDVLDASVRMWRWTGDNTYRDNPAFRNFFRETLSDYINEWQLQPNTILARQRILNRLQEKGEFVNSRGIPSYTEGTTDFTIGSDLLAAEYRAIRSYAEIAANDRDKLQSSQMQKDADELQRMIETIFWNPQAGHFYGWIRGDQSGAGSGDTLILYFAAANNPDHIQKALDYVSNPGYWGKTNIEDESYVPITLFRFGRSGDAYKVLFDLTRKDKPRREYPEVSYAAVAAIVSGAMGIEPSHARESFDVRTLAQPLERDDDLAVTSLHIRNNVLNIQHAGRARSTVENTHGPALKWKAEFAGACRKMQLNGRPTRGTPDLLPGGTTACFTIVAVPVGGTATVTMR